MMGRLTPEPKPLPELKPASESVEDMNERLNQMEMELNVRHQRLERAQAEIRRREGLNKY